MYYIHKVQGLTLENIVISFNLIKQRAFNYGQIYVALSRSTSLQGMHILGQIESKHVKANPKDYEMNVRFHVEQLYYQMMWMFWSYRF